MNKNQTVDKKRRRILARYILAWSDMNKSRDACKQIIERIKNIQDPLFQPLQEAAVVSYSRPFSHNDGYGILPKRFSKFDQAQLSITHRLVINQRNKHVAHSDKDVKQVVIYNKGTITFPGGSGSPGHGFAVDSTKLDIGLINELDKMCSIQITRLQENILKEIDLVIDQNDIKGLHELISLRPYKSQFLNFN